MKFYPFHIGDYASHTAHLNPIEDIAYRRCLDWYYLHEKPLPLDLPDIARLIRMRDHADAVANVVREFFKETGDGWTHARADAELESYRRMADGGRKGAAKRWSKGGDSPPITPPMGEGSPPHANPNANQEPLTKNQEPLKNYPAPNGAEATPRESLPNLDDLPDGLSYHDALFQVAVPWMVANGTKESNARSLLGGAEKRLGPEGAWALASECMDKKPLEPAAWLAAALNARIKRPKNNPYESEKDRSRREAFEKLTGRRKDDPITIEI